MLSYYTNQSSGQIHWYFLARECSCACNLFESRQFKVTVLEQYAKHCMEPANTPAGYFKNNSHPVSISDNQCKTLPFGLIR